MPRAPQSRQTPRGAPRGETVPVTAGTSGWQYRDWRGVFYPPGVPQRRWLEHYAGQFATVENNGTFYRLPCAGVRSRAGGSGFPSDFVMTVKASRYLTHVRRLRDPAEPVRRLLDAAAGLGGRLGPVLLQLPPDLRAVPGTAGRVPAPVPGGGAGGGGAAGTNPGGPARYGTCSRTRNAALCWADRKGSAVTPLWRTADWGYLRLHEGDGAPWPGYSERRARRVGRADRGHLGRRPATCTSTSTTTRTAPRPATRPGWPRPSPAAAGRPPGLARMGGGRVRLGDAARVVRRQGRQKGAAAAGRTARSA